jgi:hypothetical protein
LLRYSCNFSHYFIEKIDAFRAESEMLSTLIASIFHAFFGTVGQPNFAIFVTLFFTNSENATKSKFRQERLNILRVLKFM